MQNKTCGECKHFFLNSEGHCKSNDGSENAHNDACTFFEPKVITNGDRIRGMSNEELIQFKTRAFCFYCAYHVESGGRFMVNCDQPQGKTCVDGLREWLNAPADACVKQNGNHDTQTDLCKADNTESEWKDEQ